MPSEIRILVVKAGYPAPTLKSVERALSNAYKQDPSRFGSDSSRRILVEDIAGLIIERNKSAKKNRGEKRSPKGDITSYPLGYEYAVLTAEQIRSRIEDIRERTWKTREVPFTSYEEAKVWMFTQRDSDERLQQDQPARVNLNLELVFGDPEDVSLAMQDINKFPNQEEKGDLGTWLEGASEALRKAVLNNAYVSNLYGPTLKIESRRDELNLIDLAYSMPLEKFTWSQRLEAYLKRFNANISAGLSPDLGLGKERTKNSSSKWKNAAGNLNRDYRNALKKVGWSPNT